MSNVAALERSCEESLGNDYASSSDKCGAIITYIQNISGQVSPYDNRIFTYDWDPNEDKVINYFTISDRVQDIYAAIHVTESTKDPVFEMKNPLVKDALILDNLLDYSWYYEELIRKQHKVLVYAGEFDSRDGPKTQEFWLRQLDFEGKEEFWD